MNLQTSFRPIVDAKAAGAAQNRRTPSALFLRVLLAAVCAGCCGIALLWSLTTPLLQQNDELGHLDYVFALRDAGYGARMVGPVRFVATAQGRYLVDRLAYRKLKYSFAAKAPTGYGSRAFVRHVDAGEPPLTAIDPKAGLPYVGYVYPEPYYVALAQMMAFREAMFGPGIYEDALLCRIVDVAFLLATLLGIYVGFRALRATRLAAIAATAVAGTLPIVSIVFSSVQPDVVTVACVTVAIAFSLRASSPRGTFTDFASIVASLVALAFVKPYYALVLAASLIPVAAIARGRSAAQFVRYFACAEVAIGVSVAIARTLVIASPAGSPYVPISSSLLVAVQRSLENIYGGGPAFAGFWYREGVWLSRPIVTGDSLATLKTLLLTGEVVVCALMLLATARAVRLTAGQRMTLRAFYDTHAQAIVLATVYIAWTGFLVLVDVSMNNTFGLLGRYWVPMLLPLLAAVNYYAPAALVRGAAIDRARLCSASAFLAFTLFLSVLAYRSEYERFYGTTPGADRADKFISVTSVRIGSQANCNCFDPVVVRGQSVSIAGSGLDSDAGLPGRGAYLTIDGRQVVRAYYGAPRGSEVVGPLFDDAMHDIAFDATVATDRLALGKHVVRVYIENASGNGAKAWPYALTVTVRRGS